MLIPDPDLDFLAIPDPGSRGQKGSGSATLTVADLVSLIPKITTQVFTGGSDTKLLI